MTLGQIYKFSEINSSINSCLRSVLSLIYALFNNECGPEIKNKIAETETGITTVAQLQDSVIDFYNQGEDKFIFPDKNEPFHVVGVSIEIKNREVSSWNQPLLVEANLHDYALISLVFESKRYYLLSLEKKPGYKSGFIYGISAVNNKFNSELIDKLNFDKLKLLKKIKMSEEGGRFLHTDINKSFYEIEVKDLNLHFENFILVNENEIHRINLLGFLSMEARSMLFFSKYIYKNLKIKSYWGKDFYNMNLEHLMLMELI